MSNRLSAAERAAREFLQPYIEFWKYRPAAEGRFIVNREGHAREQRPEIQWMLKKGWITRERKRSPSGVCRNRQITYMALTAAARRALGIAPKQSQYVQRQELK